MKKAIIGALCVATMLSQAVPAKAQIFSRESVGGAVLGGIAGGVIGHNNGRRTAEGIGIGAGAGLLIGALSSNYRRDYYGGHYYRGPYAHGYYSHDYYYGPGYNSRRPNYAVGGALLGGLAGGIIGHNNGRHTAEGIAIGAGAGLLMGGLAEYELRRRERLSPYYYEYPQQVVISQPATVLTTTPVVTQSVQEQAPQPVTVINNYASGSSSVMSSANALFGR
jgi:outer membrane lipoprotein SlyB